MRTINRRDALLAGMAAVIASTARGAGTTRTSFSGATLEIDGQLAGFARSVGGGAIIFAELLDNTQGSQRLVAKAPSGDSFKLAFAPSAVRKSFLQWGISSVGKGVVAASANIIYYAGPDEVARIALSNVSVSKFGLTDVVSPGGSVDTVGFAIELNAAAYNMQVKTVPAATPVLVVKLPRVSANLVIPGVIDAPDSVIAMRALESRAVAQSPEPQILPIDLLLSGAALMPFLDWAREWLSGRRTERTAQLRLLDPRLGSEVGRIDLLGVGIVSFQPPGFRSGSADQLYVVNATLSCRSIKADLKDIGN